MKQLVRWFVHSLSIATLLLTSSCCTHSAKSKSDTLTWVRFLTPEQIKALAADDAHYPGLLARITEVQPSLAPSEKELSEWSSHQTARLLGFPLLAGYAAQGLVKWIGGEVGDQMAKHSAQISGSADVADWWDPKSPQYAAIELRRDQYSKDEFKATENLLDVIVLIRPVGARPTRGLVAIPPPPGSPDYSSFQLVPVYWREAQSEATVWGKKLSASLTLTLQGSWTDLNGTPSNLSFITWSWLVPVYEMNETRFTDVEPKPGAKPSDQDAIYVTIAPKVEQLAKGTVPSQFFALPNRPAALHASVQIAESDENWFAKHLKDLGDWISGRADDAKTAVTNKLTPSTSN